MVFEALVREGPLDRKSLVDMTGLVDKTIGKVTRCEQDEGWLAFDTKTRKWSLGRSCGAVLAIAMGHESARIALVDPHGRRLGEFHHDEFLLTSHQDGRGVRRSVAPSVFKERLATALRNVMAQARKRSGEPLVRSCTIAWSAPIGADTEGPVWPLARSWRGVNLRGTVTEALALAGVLDVPVFVANDADAMLLGEARWGVARHACIAGGTVIGVLVRSGIGAATVSRGKLVQGAYGSAGELGHVEVSPAILQETGIDAQVVTNCYCGLPESHLERYVSARAIIDRLARFGVVSEDGSYSARVRELTANHADPRVIKEMEHAGHLIGWALRSPALMFGPSLVVLSAAPHHQTLATSAAQALSRLRPFAVPVSMGSPPPDGDWMTMLGAATIGIEQTVLPYLPGDVSYGRFLVS